MKKYTVKRTYIVVDDEEMYSFFGIDHEMNVEVLKKNDVESFEQHILCLEDDYGEDYTKHRKFLEVIAQEFENADEVQVIME